MISHRSRGEPRTVHPCWPEDSLSAAKTRKGIGGGGRPSTAWAYSIAGLLARSGLAQSRALRSMLGDDIRDPVAIAALVIVAQHGPCTRKRVRAMIELLRSPPNEWPQRLVEMPGYRDAAQREATRAALIRELGQLLVREPCTSRELGHLHGTTRRQTRRMLAAMGETEATRAPVCDAADVARVLDVTPQQARAMARTLAWLRAGHPGRAPLDLIDLSPAERRAALAAVRDVRHRTAQAERGRASGRAADRARKRSRSR